MHLLRYIFSQKILRIAFVWVVLASIASANYGLNIHIARQQIQLVRAETESEVIEMDSFQHKLAEVKQQKESGIEPFKRLSFDELQLFEKSVLKLARQYALAPVLKNVRYSDKEEVSFVEYELKMGSDLIRLMAFSREMVKLPFDFDVVTTRFGQGDLLFEYSATFYLYIESL
jgi:hypothetical protein